MEIILTEDKRTALLVGNYVELYCRVMLLRLFLLQLRGCALFRFIVQTAYQNLHQPIVL